MLTQSFCVCCRKVSWTRWWGLKSSAGFSLVNASASDQLSDTKFQEPYTSMLSSNSLSSATVIDYYFLHCLIGDNHVSVKWYNRQDHNYGCLQSMDTFVNLALQVVIKILIVSIFVWIIFWNLISVRELSANWTRLSVCISASHTTKDNMGEDKMFAVTPHIDNIFRDWHTVWGIHACVQHWVWMYVVRFVI